jgi:hypothetical protein
MDKSRSNLMTFFDYNRDHEDGRHLLYFQFPTHYIFKVQEKVWQPRQKRRTVGRIYHCNFSAGKRYYLRLLFITVPGPTFFEDLRTFQGIIYDTFKAACIARGLVDNNNHWIQCFEEGVTFLHGTRLRSLFIIALTHGDIVNSKSL